MGISLTSVELLEFLGRVKHCRYQHWRYQEKLKNLKASFAEIILLLLEWHSNVVNLNVHVKP